MTRRHPLDPRLPLPTLDPPATPDELAWWEQAQKPHRRSSTSQAIAIGVPFLVASQLSWFLHPSQLLVHQRWLWDLALVAGCAAFGGWTMWRGSKGELFQQAVRAKRLREALAAPAAEGAPSAVQSVGRHASP
ncbi:MAG TPA: hypothetical protein VMH39_02470 [Gemmatimonadaceae bacterium]|nr:hypothetical protein [Gemmatimonadaceae bacterium]